MALLLIQSHTPSLLTVNGQFCGRVDDSPHTYVTHDDERGYLALTPLTDSFLPLAREIQVRSGHLLPPADGVYAIEWPESLCQIELRPAPLTPSASEPPVIPADAQDVVRRPVPDNRLLCSWRDKSAEYARLCTDDGQILDTLQAKRFTWDTPEILHALEETQDFVGHASLCTYRLTRDGFSLLSRQSVWSSGAPRWPSTPLQTLRAYLEALRIGADAEAVHYLAAPDRHSALGSFDRVVELRFPLQHAPENLPLALGVLSIVSPTLARVQAVCARARASAHAQGTHKLEEIRLFF